MVRWVVQCVRRCGSGKQRRHVWGAAGHGVQLRLIGGGPQRGCAEQSRWLAAPQAINSTVAQQGAASCIGDGRLCSMVCSAKAADWSSKHV